MKRGVAVLGSTGSIGTQTLSIIDSQPERFFVASLTAGKNLSLLREQIIRFRPEFVSVSSAEDSGTLSREFPGIEFGYGAEGNGRAVGGNKVEIVVMGIVGFAALAPTLEAIRLGRRIALANKEALVVAGHLLKVELAKAEVAKGKPGRAEVIPVDSEHNALFQLLEGRPFAHVDRLVLTASGGPLLRRPDLPLEDVTPAIAIQHPNWKMGPKISVDSASLMNKGLELIEACQLFDVPPEKIEVWVHPQSIVHGAIWLKDNTCLAQLSKPDMRSAIGYALSYPDRIERVIPKLSLPSMANLEFMPPDEVRFPALRLAREAYQAGPSHLIVLNAANEEAVQAFLSGRLLFSEMASCIEKALDAHRAIAVSDIPAVYAVDSQARQEMKTILEEMK